MTNNLNMNNKRIINLITPTEDTDAAPKKYVDDSISNQDFSSFFKKDGSDPMTSDINVGGHKIINLEDPASCQIVMQQPKSMLMTIYIKLKFNQVITKMSLVILCQVHLNGQMK